MICPAVVQVQSRQFVTVQPERTFAVHKDELVAIPLFDGRLVKSAHSTSVLKYLGTVSLPSTHCKILWPDIHSNWHGSGRFALFQVVAKSADGTTDWVALPQSASGGDTRCYDCRLVHFMIDVQFRRRFFDGAARAGNEHEE